MQNICDYLTTKKYPGRGIYVAKGQDKETWWCAYWIMGRSENSRNRIFEEVSSKDKRVVMAKAADESKVTDPHLIIYNPLQVDKDSACTVITNGDQTDTIIDQLKTDSDPTCAFIGALKTREYEDDEPNWTPRISALINSTDNSFLLSILKKEREQKNHCVRVFYHYDKMCIGRGRLITTYCDEDTPLPTFDSDPILLEHDASSLTEFKDKIWQSLNEENRISLLVCEINRDIQIEIINKYERVN